MTGGIGQANSALSGVSSAIQQAVQLYHVMYPPQPEPPIRWNYPIDPRRGY